jgi:hypothetical protein
LFSARNLVIGLIGFSLLITHCVTAQTHVEQVMVRGTVYDITQKIPLSDVSVVSKFGAHTRTDSLGDYQIIVFETDSICFSYLSKGTAWFSVKAMNVPLSFDVALKVYAPDLPPIYITKGSYREDSLRNRQDYAKIFNYRKPRISTTMNPEDAGAGVGFDLDAIIDMFHFDYNKRQKGYQKFFEWEEQEKFIDHRFSKTLIKKLTDIKDEQMDDFIKQYRPTYEFMEGASDFELGLYIQKCKEDYDTGHPSNAAIMMSTFRNK